MFTKNYIHRNSACPQRASPEWPRDQCVGTMLSGMGRGVQALWSGWWDSGLTRGCLGAQLRGWEPKFPSWEAQPGSWPRQRWAGGLEHSGTGAPGASDSCPGARTDPSSGRRVQMCSGQGPRGRPRVKCRPVWCMGPKQRAGR